MRATTRGIRRLVAAVAVACAIPASAQVSWTTIVNNGDLVPGTTANFNSYNQPAVNSAGLVVFRARGRVLTGGETLVPDLWSLAMIESGMVQQGVFTRDMAAAGPLTVLAKRGTTVPQPNNTEYNGAPASFIEFPSSPRIDPLSSHMATRAQHEPVYTYLAADGVSEIRVGTAGVYANPGSGLLTGVGLFGAVWEVQPDMSYGLSFPWFSVPDAPPGTRFDQFPGSPAAFMGSKVAFKGNFTDPSDGLGKTGVYVRDVLADGGKSPVMHIAGTTVVIPNQPAGGIVKFGATAAPSGANGYVAFTGWDIEEAPTLGGIYRAPVMNNPPLQALAGVGQQVPGEVAGTVFRQFGEGLTMSEDGRFVAFWATWGTESTPKILYCPVDGNVDLLAYCNATYPEGFLVQIPVHQGIFVADAQIGQILPIAKTAADGITDMLYWVFSGAPPGVGGSEDDDREPPRWRSSAFAALAAKAGHYYGTPAGTSPFQIAFKARRNGVDGIYLRKGTLPTPLTTLVEALVTPGKNVDVEAPAGSIVTTVGIERDGFRHENLVIAVGMLYETVETSIGWGGLYLARIPSLDTLSDLSVTQVAAPATGGVGKDIVYFIDVANNGPVPNTATVTDTLPAGSTFIWASPGCSHAAGTVTCNVGALATGATAELMVVARPTAAGTATNTVAISGTVADHLPANNTSTSNVTVNTLPAGVPIVRYRLYSPVTLEHHFTTDLNEYNTLGSYVGTWIQEGASGKVLDNPGSFNAVAAVPYYRLYDTTTRWHLWTTDANEYYTLIQYPWWNGEGVDGYILPSATAGATRLYRLNYPFIPGLHHWTIDKAEYDALIADFGWVGEGNPEYVIQ